MLLANALIFFAVSWNECLRHSLDHVINAFMRTHPIYFNLLGKLFFKSDKLVSQPKSLVLQVYVTTCPSKLVAIFLLFPETLLRHSSKKRALSLCLS